MNTYASDEAAEKRKQDYRDKIAIAAETRARNRQHRPQHVPGLRVGRNIDVNSLNKRYHEGRQQTAVSGDQLGQALGKMAEDARKNVAWLRGEIDSAVGPENDIIPSRNKGENEMPNRDDDPGTYRVDRVVLSKSQSGKPIIELFREPLQYAVLTLFEGQFGLLMDVGIDPNKLEPGQPHYSHFIAHYEETEKLNQKGNPYKNVTHLAGSKTASQTDDLLAEILMQMKALNALVLSFIPVEDEAPPAAKPIPHPATRPDRQAITQSGQATNGRQPQPAATAVMDAPEVPAEEEDGQMFDYFYGNGQPVDTADRTTYTRYLRAHREKKPASQDSLHNWDKFAGRAN